MSNDNILLLTKDALCKEYLPIYGNYIWKGKTPNIDDLAKKGTVFNRHISAAPSTVMAFRAMVMGKFAHEQPYSNYTPKEVPENDNDLFSIAERNGYKGHIIWDEAWNYMVLRYGNCYGKNTVIHSIPEIRQGVGCHYNHKEPIVANELKLDNTINRIVDEVKNIVNSNEKIFMWIHLPHVLNGRTSYGSDIDAFDRLIGLLRGCFSDNNIFISADHGNMNAQNGKYCYGFDVNTSAVEIPLITPRIDGIPFYDGLTSNVDIKSIIFDRTIIKREIVYSDCAYYAQPQRKLAIYKGNFVYIYNKSTKKEELYDINSDRYELCDLNNSIYRDPDRKLKSPVREYYYSPYWDSAQTIVDGLRAERIKIWKNAPKAVEIRERLIRRAKNCVIGIVKIFKKA